MLYGAHLCSSSKLGCKCKGAERPSAAQRRAERRAVRYCSSAERRSAAQALSAVRRNGTQSAQSVASGTGELPIIEPVIESCIRTPGAHPERPM